VDYRNAVTVQLVGVFLVRDEDVFVERAIRNVAHVCDRMYAFDHLSSDGTGEILRRLAQDLDHLVVRRTSDAGDSHRAIEGYTGTRTWVLGVDGDELYDPVGLTELKERLALGVYDDAFHLKGHVLNCTELDEEAGRATGYLAPPSRPATKLFNLAAVGEWSGCLERLHDGRPVFRAGYAWESLLYTSDETDWDDDPLRMLHVCFLPRSTKDADGNVRLGLPETGAWRRGPRGVIDRLRRRRHLDPRMKEYRRRGSSWKQEWYARGPLVSVDARRFLERAQVSANRVAASSSSGEPAKS
jgi:hypothetical protein